MLRPQFEALSLCYCAKWVVDALLMAALPKQDQSRVEPRLLLGTRSAQYGGIFVVNTHPVEDFKAAKPTLHIIIPTTGTINQPLQCGSDLSVLSDILDNYSSGNC